MNPIEIIVETTQAIAKDSTDASAYKKRAIVLSQMAQFDDALKDLDALIDTLKVEDAEVFQLRGSIRMQKGDKKGALEDVKRAMEINPELIKMFEGEYRK